ncbi:MAG TPA: hypothetical protein VLH77_06110 [Gammaproteobacteria bacterium]|nr:hypothetical protein [Gammaproteobacteria bacterium]
MFSKISKCLTQLLHPSQSLSPTAKEYLSYLKAAYPNNHNYKVKKNRLVPTRDLAKRYNRVRELYPEPLTSFLDIGSSKGFFVFDASENPNCTRSLGIDVYQYDIDVCRWLKDHLHNNKVRFEFMRLHELADQIDEFGGPFQTVLMLNMYQYLYFGSVRNSDRYLDHDEIFKHLRKICNERIIFNNRVNLADCQNVEQIEKASEHSQNYSEEKIIAAASRYFNVVPHGKIGQYPLWTLDVKETAASTVSAEELKEVFEAWANNFEFRNQFKKDPEKALHDAGFAFDTSKLQKIKSLLKKQENKIENEALDKRESR